MAGERIVSIILGSTGLLFFGFAAIAALRHRRSRAVAVQVAGTIVGHLVREGVRRPPIKVYAAKLSFTDEDRRRHRATDLNETTVYPNGEVGQSVTVLYDPSDPTRATLGARRWRRTALVGFGDGLAAIFLTVVILGSER